MVGPTDVEIGILLMASSAPYSRMQDSWNDQGRVLWRNIRKFFWLPASPEAGIISRMIDELLDLAYRDDKTTRPDAVTVSFPGLVALYHDDISDGAAYAGVRAHARGSGHSPHEVVTTYVGHGHGLCASYWDQQRCFDEESKLPGASLLSIEYTEHALVLHYSQQRGAADYSWPSYHPFLPAASFDLGFVHRADELYVRDLTSFVRNLLIWHAGYINDAGNLTVMLTGSFDDDGRQLLQDVIEATSDVIQSRIEIVTSSAKHVSARGAAEISWRMNALEEHERKMRAKSTEMR
jgi:hypothetical protein